MERRILLEHPTYLLEHVPFHRKALYLSVYKHRTYPELIEKGRVLYLEEAIRKLPAET